MMDNSSAVFVKMTLIRNIALRYMMLKSETLYTIIILLMLNSALLGILKRIYWHLQERIKMKVSFIYCILNKVDKIINKFNFVNI